MEGADVQESGYLNEFSEPGVRIASKGGRRLTRGGSLKRVTREAVIKIADFDLRWGVGCLEEGRSV